MAIDTAEIHVRAGNGGDGARSFRREKYVARGGPDGGDGGLGGSVYLVATAAENTLRRFRQRRRFRAGHGAAGARGNRHGRDGEDALIPVPLGTVVTAVAEDGAVVLQADLLEEGQEVVAARGGDGGRGNARFVTAVNQEPLLREKGEEGEARRVLLEVKIIADVGVIGVPNAGKSSFIGRVTAASPKVAPYPFTTLEPQLGVWETRGEPVVFAEIPGLVEGAHRGVGLGHDFLRHAERTRVFLHLLDGAAPDPVGNYRQVNDELARYDPALAQRAQVIAVNKADLPEMQAQLDTVTAALAGEGAAPLAVSAATGEGMDALLARVLAALQAAPVPSAPAAPPPHAVDRRRSARRRGVVARDEAGALVVRWPAAERLTALADVDDHRVVGQLLQEFRRLGVTAALEAAGAASGDMVVVGEWAFPWGEAHRGG